MGHTAGRETEMQKLMTEELAKVLPAMYATEEERDPAARVHYFSCTGGWDWYLVEYDATTGEAFGLVRGVETEWGCFSIREMEEVNRSHGFNVIERDVRFSPKPVSALEGGR